MFARIRLFVVVGRSLLMYRLVASTLLVSSLLMPSLLISGAANADSTDSQTLTLEVSTYVENKFGKPPVIPTGPLNSELNDAVATVFVESVKNSAWGPDQNAALQTIADSEDARLVWLISDMMRFIRSPGIVVSLSDAVTALIGITFENGNYWGKTTDHLIAWNVPEPPDYLQTKRALFTSFIPGWENIFVEGNIDWRHVSWGGVLIDNRPYDKTDEECNCIPAADNPAVTPASEASWLDDEDIVFGIEVNGEYRAYPRRIMEVREMVNDTLGGRDLGIPYCTLCASAQAYFTDQLAEGIERPVLRTSGLLIRSNKVMYDVNTNSVFDTFLGQAVTGPLAKKGVKLQQASVVTTQWGDWRKAHPNTTVLAESLALGRDFDFRNNRDASGPIFPIGGVDPRLPVHEDIVGVVSESGKPIAFQKNLAFAALAKGENVEYENIVLQMDGGGIKAVDKDGKDLGGHEAFWFAWSQFHPETVLWPKQQ